jgi:hypothetical protein
MTPEQLKEMFPNAPPSFIERNRHILSGVESTERKPNPLPPLAKGPPVQRGRKSRLVAVVTILSFRRRELDDDNLTAGAKPLRDAIATSLGIDDGDKRIRWEVRGVKTEGPEHTIVKITAL